MSSKRTANWFVKTARAMVNILSLTAIDTRSRKLKRFMKRVNLDGRVVQAMPLFNSAFRVCTYA
jgi:hypothetical protein